MTTRSTQLALGQITLPNNVSTVIYTVPANRRTIWRSAAYRLGGAVTATFTERIKVGASTFNIRPITLAPSAADLLEFWRVLNAAEEVHLLNSTGASITVTVLLSGAELVV